MRLLSIAGKLQEQSACCCRMESGDLDEFNLFRPKKASILVRRCKSVNGTVDTTTLKSLLKTKNSPTSPKKVHFADSNGLDLVEVKKFVSSSEDFSELRVPNPMIFRPRSFTVPQCSTQRSSEDRLVLPCFSLKPCFDVPKLYGITDSVKRNGICLEDVSSDARWLTLICRVWNYSFNKEVSVRFSFDGWESFTEMHALHTSHAGDGLTDKFEMKMHVPKRVKALEFALRYRVDGMEFWDNNDSKNYKVIAFS